MSKPLILATRKSRLALRQAELAREYLAARLPGVETELLPMSTTGDRKLAWSLTKKGGKGLFTGELEEALLAGEADLAVHSAKDLPTAETAGLSLAGFLPREDPRDVLIVRDDVEYPREVASSSPRRRLQAKLLVPQACWGEIRGNVETRLRKVHQAQTDATILAAAGLNRLGITEYPGLVFKKIPVQVMVPAAGQAAIAIQCRSGEVERFGPLMCAETGFAVRLERDLLARFGGGCQVAMGVLYQDGVLHVFHESFGRREVPLATRDGEEIRAILDRFMEETARKE